MCEYYLFLYSFDQYPPFLLKLWRDNNELVTSGKSQFNFLDEG